MTFYNKRFFDFSISLIAIFLLLPIFLLVAVLVRSKLGSPILFRQSRPGLNGKPFTMFKFRTMTDEHNIEGNLLPDVDRLTSFGRFLRSSSFDELPEFWNVLKGDMSLVGPRPLLLEYLPLYTEEQGRRHEVLPGITGWAQVNGRNSISWNDKFILDIWYVNNRSFCLDIKILWLTLVKVASREAVSPSDEEIMPKLNKNNIKIN